MPNFPHTCCDGHEPIGFGNGPAESVESCPVCLMREQRDRAEMACIDVRLSRGNVIEPAIAVASAVARRAKG